MKKELMRLSLILFLFIVLFNISSFSQTYTVTLNTPVYTQPSHSNLCWREVCCSILSYYGKTTSEITVGYYGTQGIDIPNFLCDDATYSYTACNGWLVVILTLSIGIPYLDCHYVNVPMHSMKTILNYFGKIKSSPLYSGVYPWNTIRNEIFGGRPVCARVAGAFDGDYYAKGGHQILVRGVYSNGTDYHYYVMDPRPNFGYEIHTKAWLDSYWTHTMLLITPPPKRIVPLILKYTMQN